MGMKKIRGNVVNPHPKDLSKGVKMKRYTIGLILLLFINVSCSKSPQEKLVGEWQYEGYTFMKFNSDGTGWMQDGRKKRWNVIKIGKDTLEIRVTDNIPEEYHFFSQEFDVKMTIYFISDDEFVLQSGDKPFVLKRKKVSK